MQVAPLGDVSASLTLTDIPIGRVLSLAPSLAKDSAGAFSGEVTFRSSAQKLRDPTAWVARGTARADKVRLLAVALDEAVPKFNLRRGELALTDTSLGVEGLKVGGS